MAWGYPAGVAPGAAAAEFRPLFDERDLAARLLEEVGGADADDAAADDENVGLSVHGASGKGYGVQGTAERNQSKGNMRKCHAAP